MGDFDVLGPFVIALLMGMGTLCVLTWAVLSGALADTDKAALNFYRAEMDHDRFANAADTARD